MKQLLVIAALFFSAALFAQSPVTFTKVKHDFGKIKKDVPVTYFFVLKNTGAKPLVIETATAECGCTTPEYPKEPIAKGKEAKIKVTYNAANPGTFKKNVTVKFANIPEPTILIINGEVEVAKAKTK